MKMFGRSLRLILPIIVIFAACALWGQSYLLRWSTIDAGGSEGDVITSTSYKLSCNIGQSTAIGDTDWIGSSSYLVHPGFRKVDLDWRVPYTRFIGTIATVDTITVDHVTVEWTGRDTTTEDGFGWGMWVYDVQYRRQDEIIWTDLDMATPDTLEATTVPLEHGHWYIFRVRGHDLATNFYDWSLAEPTHTIVDVESVYVNTALYTLYLRTTGDFGRVWVNDVSYPSPYSGNYSGGAVVDIEVPDSVNVGDTIIARFDHWNHHTPAETTFTHTMIGGYSDTANYLLSYKLTVASAYGTPTPSVGGHWYSAGATVEARVSPALIDLGTTWAICTGFTGTGAVPSVGSGTYAYIDMTAPGRLTWNWVTVPEGTELCTLIVFSPYGHPMPAETTFYPIGTTVYCTVEPTFGTHNCSGWMGGGSITSSPAGGNTFSFVIGENSWLVWIWDGTPRMPLIVENDGMSFDPTDGYDTPNPTVGINWLPLGITTASVTTPADGQTCIGFWGDGSVSTADTTHSTVFDLDEPSYIYWRWVPTGTPVCYISVYSPYPSTSFPPLGTSGFACGTTVNAHIASPYGGHNCSGYWGSGSVPTALGYSDPTPTDVTFIIDENSELVWEWDGILRFPFTVYNEGTSPTDPDGYDTPDPTVGMHWYTAASSVTASVTTPADGMQCIGYFGSGSIVPAAGAGHSVTFAINRPTTISWRWAPEGATIVYLTVFSEYGSPVPPIGTIGYVSGALVNASVASPVWTGSEWIACSGWDRFMSGVHASGATPALSFNITANCTLVWQWGGTTRWPFVVASAYDTPNPAVGTHWYDDGDHVNADITLIDGTYRCIGYDGSGSCGDGPFNHTEFDITMPSTITWLWLPASAVKQVIIVKNPIADVLGSITVSGTTMLATAAETIFVPTGTNLAFGVSTPDMTADGLSRYSFINWTDGPTTSTRTAIINTDVIFTANYAFQHQVIVQKDPAADTLGTITIDVTTFTTTAAETIWWNSGTALTFGVSTPDADTLRQFIFNRWADGTTTATRTATISAPTTFTAQYNVRYRITVAKVRDIASYPPFVPACIHVGTLDTCNVSTYSWWANSGVTVNFNVDNHYWAAESVYIFNGWTDGGASNVHAPYVVTAPATFTAKYLPQFYNICFFLSQYGVDEPDSIIWTPADPIDARSTNSMSFIDMITVKSCSSPDTLPLRLYLGIIGAVDDLGASLTTGAPDASWIFGPTGESRNTFSIRARFENSPTPPTTYDPNYDYLKLTTADRLDPAYDYTERLHPTFGNYGGHLRGGVGNDLYMFLQLVAPSSSFYYDHATVILMVKARPSLP